MVGHSGPIEMAVMAPLNAADTEMLQNSHTPKGMYKATALK